MLGLERGCEVEDVARAHQRAMADTQPSMRPAEVSEREVLDAVRLVSEACEVLSSGRLRRMYECAADAAAADEGASTAATFDAWRAQSELLSQPVAGSSDGGDASGSGAM